MSKYKFSLIERRVIYEVYGPKCFYSGKPILINDFHIDHIIPENKIDEEEKIKERLGLWEEFKINSYYNWVPSHPFENLRKGKIEFTDNTILHYLNIVKHKVPKLLELEEKYKKEQDKDKVLSYLGIKLELGIITRYEITEFLDNLLKYNFSKSQEDLEYFLKKFLLLDFRYYVIGPAPLTQSAYQLEYEVFNFFKEHYNTKLEPMDSGYDIRFETKDEIMGVEIKLVKINIRPVIKDEFLKRFQNHKEISKLILIIFCYNEPFEIKPNVFGSSVDFSVEEFRDDDLKSNPNIIKYSIKFNESKKTIIIVLKKLS